MLGKSVGAAGRLSTTAQPGYHEGVFQAVELSDPGDFGSSPGRRAWRCGGRAALWMDWLRRSHERSHGITATGYVCFPRISCLLYAACTAIHVLSHLRKIRAKRLARGPAKTTGPRTPPQLASVVRVCRTASCRCRPRSSHIISILMIRKLFGLASFLFCSACCRCQELLRSLWRRASLRLFVSQWIVEGDSHLESSPSSQDCEFN